MLEWLNQNAPWLFEGIGVVILVSIFGFIYRRVRQSKQPVEISPEKSSKIIKNNDSILNIQGDQASISGNTFNVGNMVLRREAQLALVDATLEETEEHYLIDIKVRNNSDEVIFIKRAEFNVLTTCIIRSPGRHFSMMPASFTYDINLHKANSKRIKHNISQEVKTNTVDRFAFSIASKKSSGLALGLHLFIINICIYYNEDDKFITTPQMLVLAPPDIAVAGFYQGPPSKSELEQNRDNARELLKNMDNTTIYSESILSVLKSWAEADFSNYQR